MDTTMRFASCLTIALALAIAPSSALAQHAGEHAATVEQAIARAIATATPDLRYPWALDWNAFGVRGGRDIFWHLAPPGPDQREPSPPGVHRRTGWFNVRGASGGVEVCGDADRIGTLSFDVPDLWSGQSDVIRELAAGGVTATLLILRPAVPPPRGSDDGGSDTHYRRILSRYPVFRRWRLDRTGYEPVTLTAARRCTPPDTRSATSCSVTWTVTFRPDENRPGVERCLPSGPDENSQY